MVLLRRGKRALARVLRRAAAQFGALAAALLVVACRAPTLWIGTAHSADGGAGLGAAGEAAQEQQPTAAGNGGVGEHVGAASGAEVPPAQAANPVHTSMQPMAAAQSHPDAGTRPQPDDRDAGSDPDPTDTLQPLTPSKLPSIQGQCPDLTGPGTHIFSVGGRSMMVDIYMRPDAKTQPAPGGPLILYFHSVGTSSSEVTQAFGQAAIDAVVAQGGVVAAFNATPCLRCGLADDVAWYDEDDVVSDQVTACAIAQAQIDKRRIHAIGFSAGALHTMHLALARSDVIASVVSYSGGVPAGSLEPQDPSNKVPALLAFGREGVDNALLDFNIASRDWYSMFAPLGYYVLLCDHQGGHEIPSQLSAHALRFMLDHPYRVNPEPYLARIPSELPSYCRNGPP